MSADEWRTAEIGYDIEYQKWVIEFHNSKKKKIMASKVVVKKGNGIQLTLPKLINNEWFAYDIREQFSVFDTESISYDENTDIVVITGKDEMQSFDIPKEYDHIEYAYDLRTAEGFIEFFDSSGKKIYILRNKIIIIDHLDHETEDRFYPNVRFKANKSAIGALIVTRSYIIIEGK